MHRGGGRVSGNGGVWVERSGYLVGGFGSSCRVGLAGDACLPELSCFCYSMMFVSWSIPFMQCQKCSTNICCNVVLWLCHTPSMLIYVHTLYTLQHLVAHAQEHSPKAYFTTGLRSCHSRSTPDIARTLV